MALDRQIIDIPFAAGLGQKDDPKQLSPPKLLTLENGDFTTLKQIRKRPQLKSLGTVGSAKGILAAEYRNELVALDGQSLYSLAGTTFNSKGALPVVSATSEPAIRSQAIACDSTTSGDWRITVWKPRAGAVSIQYAIQHTPTGQTLYSGLLTGSPAAAMSPKVVAVGVYFVVFYYVDNGVDELCFQSITIPTVSVAPVVGASTPVGAMEGVSSGWTAAERFYDVCAQGGRIYVAWHYGYYSSLVQKRNVRVAYLDATLTVVDLVSFLTPWTLGDHVVSGVSIIPDWDRDALGQAGVVVIVGDETGVKAQPILYSGDGLSSYAYFYGMGPAVWSTNPPRFITGYSKSSTNTVLIVFANSLTEAVGGVSDTHFELMWLEIVGINKFNIPHGTVPVVLAQRLRPCAKMFTVTDNLAATALVLPVIHESGMQPTEFAIRITPATSEWLTFTWSLLARYLPSTAGGYSTNTAGLPVPWSQPYPELPESTGGKWCSIRKTDTNETGVDTLSLSYSTIASAAEFADNLHIASGGLLWMYDGQSTVEHGFLMAPPIEARPFVDGSGTGTNIYHYAFLYAWTDARGQTHRSALSPEPVPTTGRPGLFQHATAAAVTSTNTVSITLPSLPETAKTGVIIEVYRTAANETVLYFNGYADNGTDGLDVAFIDNVPDDYDGVALEFLKENRQLYTTGGVVQNDTAPSSSMLCEHGDRLWTADSQSPGSISWTRKLIPVAAGAEGVPAEFSSYFQTRVNSNGGAVTGIGSLDEKLIVFMRDSIAFVMGEGPDDTGGGGSFAVYPLPHNVGAIRQGSVVSTAKGLLFQSDQGILLLTRSLSIEQVGLDVETYAQAATIVSGLALTTKTQTHMLDSTNSRLLALDTLTGQWSMWPLTAAPASICHYGQEVVMLMASGLMLQQTAWTPTATYGDNGVWIGAKVGTAWVHLSSMAGFQRLRRIYITGEYKSQHILNWALYQDYDDTTAAQSGTFTVAAATTKGGYQVRIDVAKQKSEAFRLVVWDTAGAYAIGEGMRLSGLTLEVGVKRGGMKMATPQVAG